MDAHTPRLHDFVVRITIRAKLTDSFALSKSHPLWGESHSQLAQMVICRYIQRSVKLRSRRRNASCYNRVKVAKTGHGVVWILGMLSHASLETTTTTSQTIANGRTTHTVREVSKINQTAIKPEEGRTTDHASEKWRPYWLKAGSSTSTDKWFVNWDSSDTM